VKAHKELCKSARATGLRKSAALFVHD